MRRTYGGRTAGFAAVILSGLIGVQTSGGQSQSNSAGLQSETPAKFEPVTSSFDYVRREVMIAMRDGVKLHTVIVVPKGAKNAPILLTRTPYNASKRTARNDSPHMLAILPQGDDVFVDAGYLRVLQDVRGKYKSEG